MRTVAVSRGPLSSLMNNNLAVGKGPLNDHENLTRLSQDFARLSCYQLEGIFTVGEAVRSTCGNSHDDDDDEENEDRFHLSLLQTIL